MGHIKLRWCCRLWYKVHYYTVTQVKYVLTYCQLICLYLQCRPITGQLHKFHRPGWFLWLKVAACKKHTGGKVQVLYLQGWAALNVSPHLIQKLQRSPCFLLIFFRFHPCTIEMLLSSYPHVVRVCFKDIIEVEGRKNGQECFWQNVLC